MERARTRSIREFILARAAEDPRGLARRIAEAYGISRQAANRHLDQLVDDGLLEQSGRTRARVYRLKRTSSLSRELRVTPVLRSDRVWEDHIAPHLSADRVAFRELCRGAFGELVRNAIEHAHASWIRFTFANSARDIDITVADDGVGIFHALARPLDAGSPGEAAEKMAAQAQARAADSPSARLFLLARNFHTFLIRSGGSVLAFDRDTDRWSAGDDDVPEAGTSVAFRARRQSEDEPKRPVREQASIPR